jgi:hypothetical protein
MATAALAVTAMATPAEAQRWGGRHHHRGHDGVSLGDALLGAILVGGVVAAASADRRAREREEVVYDYPPPPPPTEYREAEPMQPEAAPGFDGRYDEESAADACAQAAQFTGQRYARIARVMGIDDVSGSGTNWLVRGHLDLADTWRSARKGYDFRCTLGGGKEPEVAILGLAGE